MKGPGYKLSHDVRRTWMCPACGRQRKLSGDRTSLVCDCRPEGTFMKIITERTVAPRPLQTPRDHDVRSSEFGIDDLPVLQPHPSSLPPERSGARRPRPGESAAATQESKPESPRDDVAKQASPPSPSSEPTPEEKPNPAEDQVADDWGEGIL